MRWTSTSEFAGIVRSAVDRDVDDPSFATAAAVRFWSVIGPDPFDPVLSDGEEEGLALPFGVELAVAAAPLVGPEADGPWEPLVHAPATMAARAIATPRFRIDRSPVEAFRTITPTWGDAW
jgi:hypothetical protein